MSQHTQLLCHIYVLIYMDVLMFERHVENRFTIIKAPYLRDFREKIDSLRAKVRLVMESHISAIPSIILQFIACTST